jgi:PAS domain S-box-containing protein
VHVLLNATTRRDADGVVTGVVGVGQDITEQKRVSADAQLVADDLTRLIDTANAPIFGVDLEGNLTEWNRKSAELVGYSADETMGRNLVENFITQGYREKVRNVLHKAMRGDETANFELPLVTKDGQRVQILLNATTRRDAEGVVTGVVGVGQDITELKRVSLNAELVADDLTRLIDTANAPIFGVDLEGNVTEWNRKSAEIVGYTAAETMGKNLVENFITAKYRDSVRTVFEKAMRGDETANFELPLFTKSGSRVMVLLNATTRLDANGIVKGVVGVGQDITRLNETSQEAQRVADDLTRLIDTANAPIFGVDLAGKVTEWNRKAQDLVGYSKDETIGKNLVDNFIAAEYRDSVRLVLSKALRGDETANYELPLFTKSGTRVDILLNATTRRDGQGSVSGVVGVGQDITRLKKISQEAERVADDLTRLIDTANAPIFGVDMQGNVTEWNRKSVEIVGYTKEETLGRHFVDNFITPEYRASVTAVLEKAMRGEGTDNYEVPLFTKSGERVDVLLNATMRRDDQGLPTGVVGVGQDITELKRLTVEAEIVANDLTRLLTLPMLLSSVSISTAM